MAIIRAGDAGLVLSDSYLARYAGLQITDRAPTEIDGTFEVMGQPGYAAQFRGSFMFSNGNTVRPLFGSPGPVYGIRETFNGTFRFELSDTSIPFGIFGEPLLLRGVLAGNDTVQGGAGNDVLQAYAGNNIIQGGAGTDVAVIDAARSATLSFHWRDQAVVYRQAAGQWDQLGGIESVRFADREYATSALPELRPLEYLASYTDLAAAYGTDEAAAWRHFSATGIAEGRLPTFSGLNYIASYRDLAAAYGANADAGARHYLTSGRAEGRAVTFDGLRYIASYGDLIPVLPHTLDAGAMHFLSSGAAEGRAVTFDPLRYLASNLDVARAYGTNEARGLDHWLEKGFTENRQTASFDAAQYLRNYADLSAAFGTDQRAAALHWIQTGANEGRTFASPPNFRYFSYGSGSTVSLFIRNGADAFIPTSNNADTPSPFPSPP